MKISSTMLTGLLVLGLIGPASASVIDFNFATSGSTLFGSPIVGSGAFTISDTPQTINSYTAYQIIAITGTVNGSQIVAPTGNYGAYYVTGPSFLDGAGANFMTAGHTNVSFFYEDAVSAYRVNTTGPFASSFVTASAVPVAPVPEPTTWSVLLAGLLMAGGAGVAMRKWHQPLHGTSRQT